MQSVKQNATELNALYEVEKGTNTIKTEQITSVEEENLSLRKELYQLLNHLGNMVTATKF
jgi:hypothetical protein